MRSLELILKKGLNWEQFIYNCKLEQIIKKSGSSVSYGVKDAEGQNWLKRIVDSEPRNLKERDIQKKWFLGGLMKCLLEDGCDPNIRVILEVGVSSCSLIKYAENEKKMQSF